MSKHKKTNQKKVSIIIPFYMQTEQELAIPLASINNQVGVDFSKIDVHLVNDAGSPIDLSKFEIFANLDLHYHVLEENSGPGVARQYGIDHSSGEYVMFIDADDALFQAGTLLDFFTSAEQHDIISSTYVAQYKSGGKLRYTTYSNNAASVYSKWIRRAYLNRIGLRFSPELRYFEDMYFISLAFMLTTDKIWMNKSSYIWMHRDDSLFRGENGTLVRRVDVYVKALRLKLEVIKRVVPAQLKECVLGDIARIYLYQKKNPPVEKKLFDMEFRALLAEFPDEFPGYSPALQILADTISQKKDGIFAGLDTSGLQTFLKKYV